MLLWKLTPQSGHDITNSHVLLAGGTVGLPDGWRELTEEEFAKSHYFMYTPDAIGWIQKKLEGEKYTFNLQLFFMYDNTGYAMTQDLQKRVRYFKFGCTHEWASSQERNAECDKRSVKIHYAETAYFCKKCKHFEVIDSSG